MRRGLPLLEGPLTSLDSAASLQDLGAMAGDPAATTRKDSTNAVEQAERKNDGTDYSPHMCFMRENT